MQLEAVFSQQVMIDPKSPRPNSNHSALCLEDTGQEGGRSKKQVGGSESFNSSDPSKIKEY